MRLTGRRRLKLVLLIVLISFLCNLKSIISASANLTIFYKEDIVELSVSPILIDDTTYVGLNDIGKLEDFDVKYKMQSDDIVISKGNIDLYLYLNSDKIKINNYLLNTENKNFVKNGEVYVPLRSIFEMLLYDVTWNSSSRTINIS